MKLKEYVRYLNAMANEHPDVEVVYACDEEGNRFSKTYFAPSLGHLNGDYFEDQKDLDDKSKINVVCLN
tara:strand:+ start:648 stop:854 length:207 start_codon:yes stop_codon:yes gene_type:complete